MNLERGTRMDSPRGREQCLARARKSLFFVIAMTGETKQSQKGQPEMRQAEKIGLLNKQKNKSLSLEGSTSGESENKLNTIERI